VPWSTSPLHHLVAFTFGSFFLVSDHELEVVGVVFLPVRVVIAIGLPVVSSRTWPAALIPMPCCPRSASGG